MTAAQGHIGQKDSVACPYTSFSLENPTYCSFARSGASARERPHRGHSRCGQSQDALHVAAQRREILGRIAALDGQLLSELSREKDDCSGAPPSSRGSSS